MKIHDIIEHFSGSTTIPVDPNAVADQIRSAGLRDRITFVEVDIDVLILRGALHSYVVRNGVYSDPETCSDIYFARNQSRAWRRLVCCKELLHVIDASVSKTASADDFEKLVKGLCSAQSSTSSLAVEGLQVWGDRLMVYYAIAIVFPLCVREAIVEAREHAEIPLSQVAEWLDIPEEACGLVLSDQWPELHKALAGRK